MPQNSLSVDNLKAVVEGLLREEYHLLLGAGASIGCKSGTGRPLPTATALTDELIRDFSLPTEGDSVDLRTAYELVEERTTKEGLNRSEYMRQRFSNCASSAEFVGRFRFGEPPQVVIKGNFHGFVGAKAVGSSGHHSDFVVEAFHSTIGDFSFGPKPIQDQWFMGA